MLSRSSPLPFFKNAEWVNVVDSYIVFSNVRDFLSWSFLQITISSLNWSSK